ncbi:MAG TPA: hypothetical protein VHE12_07660 [bacterium]|nr:hypothetical protein [bacterium]
MNPKQVDRFFKGLARDFRREAVVYLTGAAAGSLMGNVRPSLDIDFGVQAPGGGAAWAELEKAIDRNKLLTGLAVNYGEDIDRWGQITLLDYQRHAKPYKKFGKLDVRVLAPAYWSIGKMTRFLEPDVRDMAAVFKAQKVPALDLVRIWGRAVKASPRSAAQFQFARQVEHFLSAEGPGIWGGKFDLEGTLKAFRKSAGIR